VTTYAALTDVSISSLSNDQVMIYKDSSTNKWCNYTLSGFTINDSTQTILITAGSSTLASDTDVSVSSITNNQCLIYNSGTSKWINQTIDHTT